MPRSVAARLKIVAQSLQSSRYKRDWTSSRELTQTSNLASAWLALRTESRASVLVAPTWRDFSQILRGQGSLSQAAWVGRNQLKSKRGVSVPAGRADSRQVVAGPVFGRVGLEVS